MKRGESRKFGKEEAGSLEEVREIAVVERGIRRRSETPLGRLKNI